MVRHHDEHDAGRDQDPQASSGRDQAHGDFFLVAVADQHRPGQQTHRDNRCADDSGAGGKDDGNPDDCDSHTAAYRAKQNTQRLEEPVRDTRHRQKVSHQDEERDRNENEVVHRSVDPVHEDSEKLRPDEQKPKQDADAAEGKGQRMTHEKENHQRDEHADCSHFRTHWLTPFPSTRTLTVLITSEIPCSSSSTAAIGMTVLIG